MDGQSFFAGAQVPSKDQQNQ